MILKHTIAWIPMVFIAIANGAARELFYAPYVGELPAHQISCFTGIVLFFFYTFFLAGRWPLENYRQAALVGIIWLVLTVAFEFIFGHYIAGNSWNKLLNDYNIPEGRLWALVLISLAFMPSIARKIRPNRVDPEY